MRDRRVPADLMPPNLNKGHTRYPKSPFKIVILSCGNVRQS